MKRVDPARLALGCAALLWGTGWPFSKAMFGLIAPAPFLVLVVGAAALAAIVVAALRRSRVPRGRALLAHAGLGVISPGCNYWLGIEGLHETTAGAAALISSVEPLAIVLLSVVLFRTRLERRATIAVVVATAGLVVVADPAALTLRALLGSAAVAAGVALGALFVVLAQRVERLDPFAATAIQLVAGAGTLLVLALAQHGPSAFDALPSVPALALILGSGPLLDYLPYLLLAYSSARVPAQASAMLFTLMPVWGVVGSAWLLGERFGPWQTAGAVVVIAAVGWFHGVRFPSFRLTRSITADIPACRVPSPSSASTSAISSEVKPAKAASSSRRV